MRPKIQRIKVTCRTCGKEFMERASRGRQYCSRECSGLATAKLYESRRRPVVCQHCGKPFSVRQCRTDAQFCSFLCRQTGVSRRTAAIRSAKLRMRKPAKAGTYLKLHGRHAHRVIAELKIGRRLESGEVVHHKNKRRHDNHPDNLQVLPTQGEHNRIHFTKNRKCEVPGCGRKHAAKGLCLKHWSRGRKRKKK